MKKRSERKWVAGGLLGLCLAAAPLAAGAQEETVQEINASTLRDPLSHVVDLTELTQLSAGEVRERIEAYKVPEKPYLDGMPRSEGDFDAALAARNLEALADPVELRYGILVKNALVRAFPTWQRLSSEPSPEAFDYLQESMLAVGEGVVLLHSSADEKWSFVQGSTYAGWIETEAIGFCEYQEMCEYIGAEDFVVVTEPYLEVGEGSRREGGPFGDARPLRLRMGTRLPCIKETKEGFLVYMPARSADGELTVRRRELPADAVSRGYLPLADGAIAAQAKKLLGVKYGWGDTGERMDCTSTLRAAYLCFGIVLPRNSSWMMHCGLTVTDLREMTADGRRDVISRLSPGSILLMDGHAMMYLGVEDGEEKMLHNVTWYTPKGTNTLVCPMECTVTPVDIENRDGVPYYELFRYALSAEFNLR